MEKIKLEPKAAIYGKLYKIMEAVEFIKKDKTNAFHKYNYASEEAIKTIHAELVKNKVLFKLDIIEIVRDEVINTKQGINQTSNLITIKTKYSFIDSESGEFVEGLFAGAGEDKGDKGLYKAITGAIKYIMTSTFLIPTGDDAEVQDTATKPKFNPAFTPKPKAKKEPKKFGDDVEVPLVCADCDANVTLPVKEYSIEHYSRVLCIPCQKKEKNRIEGEPDD